ncbi:MAG: GNAT family N-acetyltransferase [Bacteroidota bacterium]
MVDTLETERLQLRIIKAADASFLHQLMNTPKWFSYIGDRHINSEEDAIQYMKDKMHADLAVKGFMNHVMITKETNEPVGTCSLHDREGVEGLDIGYALLPEFEGKGYASEGAKAMVKMAFNIYQQTQVSAIVNDENEGSWRLLEKIGFQHQGYIQLPNMSGQVLLYVLNPIF